MFPFSHFFRYRYILILSKKGSISLGLDASSWWPTGTMSPSKFSIGYSFRTPLPSFLRRDAEEDRPIVAKRNPLYDSPLSPSPDTVLVISANASGTLQTPRQKMQFKYTDGSHEIKEVIGIRYLIMINDAFLDGPNSPRSTGIPSPYPGWEELLFRGNLPTFPRHN